MAKRICVECGESVCASEAHVRSECFRQVVFCDSCHVKRLVASALASVRVPGQRSALAARIARAVS